MYHGGCSGSTCGGIKADRIWIFYKVLKSNVYKQLHPNAVIPVKVGDNVIDPSIIRSAVMYIVAFTFIFILGAMLIGITGPTFEEAISASMTSLGNVGPGFGSCGSLGNFSHFTPFAKFVMTVEMLLGRLEIYTLLMLFFIFKKV